MCNFNFPLLEFCFIFRTLHEQTDRALSDSQGQIVQLEKELIHAHERNKDLEHNTTHLREEIKKLNEDIILMKGSMAHIDSEKDGLLVGFILYSFSFTTYICIL